MYFTSLSTSIPIKQKQNFILLHPHDMTITHYYNMLIIRAFCIGNKATCDHTPKVFLFKIKKVIENTNYMKEII